MFSVCSHRGGGGVYPLHPTILPLVSCPFQGGTPSPSHNTSTGPMSFPGDTPVTGPRSLPGGTPGWVPPSQVRMGYPPLARSGCGTPQPGKDGVPPPTKTGYAWTGYAAGGKPLAVSRRRTVMYCFMKYIINFYEKKFLIPKVFSLSKDVSSIPTRFGYY